MAEQKKPLLSQQQMIWGGAALAVVILLAGWWFLFGSSGSATVTGSGGTAVTITSSDRTLGNRKAPIVMVEYASLTCSHCAAFNHNVFKKLDEKYIKTGKVFYIYRDFPLDQFAMQAAALARCLPADNYFTFIDLLFENQPKWAFTPNPTEGLVAMARMAGVGEDKARACMSDQAALKHIETVAQDGMTKYKIGGTPTFVVDGEVKSGEFTWEAVQAFLDPRLAGK